MKRLLAAVACWFMGHRIPIGTTVGPIRLWLYCTRGCGASEECGPAPVYACGTFVETTRVEYFQ